MHIAIDTQGDAGHPTSISMRPPRFPVLAPDRLAIGKGFLFVILAAEALALFVARLAGTLQFNNFAFFDTGANLTAQYLISRGYRPTLDFVYHYGLLPLLFGRVWFGICGLTPIACIAAMPLIDILIVWGFVRFAANLKMNLAGILIILLTASLTIPSSFINLTHGIEPVFLLHALADQGSGNRRRALALATTALFVKPSMAYFLGFILLGSLWPTACAIAQDHCAPLSPRLIRRCWSESLSGAFSPPVSVWRQSSAQ